ncbi:sucrose transport protein SUT2 [Selaginella moellendorffii]|uniref:sucrose transport protein SUT2 n=1 Tax=Selaginella moellendorffii TaxID=88036 RepID=UPI000D1C54D5|nr:sucrose transport protein SUT2 [Selaginella moellendorffii]|eukprot:XP_024518053.1 sucrose transport protein SUT2 [Selaginella moellendorffii]
MAEGSIAKRSRADRVPLKALARVASVAAGVQFGWALQLSLLTPYVQELGIPHTFASYIWLCGPISGMFVQPIVGFYSDHWEGKWGRRRPFIVLGAILVVISVLIIGFAADLGYILGDTPTRRPRAIGIFVVGFWFLDLANNTLQGPCRALLADFTGRDQRRNRRANAFFSFFISIGNILGFAAGSYNNWPKIFPFTETRGCNRPCANLKSAFMIDLILLIVTTLLSITAAQEIPWSPLTKAQKHGVSTPTTPLIPDKPDPQYADDPENVNDDDEDEEEESEAFFWELVGTLRDLPRPMWCILLVTALTWLAWFPFTLFDTDWFGREVFKGEPGSATAQIYDRGVRMGSFGLMLNSVVLGITSIVMEPLCRMLKPSFVWGIGNFIMAASFAAMIAITYAMKNTDRVIPPTGTTIGALVVFAALGAPLAVTYSIPFALASHSTNNSGGGQGLAMGVLNLAVVVPQIIISLGSGPWDALFGGGNVPSFALALGASFIGGVLAFLILPRPAPEFRSRSIRRTRSSPIP